LGGINQTQKTQAQQENEHFRAMTKEDGLNLHYELTLFDEGFIFRDFEYLSNKFNMKFEHLADLSMIAEIHL